MNTAAQTNSVLQSLELDAATIESLPESVLSELIGFLEYENHLARDQQPPASRGNPISLICQDDYAGYGRHGARWE